jgi:hypothetical protein
MLCYVMLGKLGLGKLGLGKLGYVDMLDYQPCLDLLHVCQGLFELPEAGLDSVQLTLHGRLQHGLHAGLLSRDVPLHLVDLE